MLTEPQIERYARHVLLREVGGVGQQRLLDGAVHLHDSTSALGWATCYLVLAGVGRLSIAPGLVVPADGFGPLLPSREAGRRLADALPAALAAFNPDVTLVPERPTSALFLAEAPVSGPGVWLRASGGHALAAATPPVGPCGTCAAALFGRSRATPAADALAGSLGATILLTGLAAATPSPSHVLHGGPDGLVTIVLRDCAHPR